LNKSICNKEKDNEGSPSPDKSKKDNEDSPSKIEKDYDNKIVSSTTDNINEE